MSCYVHIFIHQEDLIFKKKRRVWNEEIGSCRHIAFPAASSQTLPSVINNSSPGLLDVSKCPRMMPRKIFTTLSMRKMAR